ncbi:hypothetical protein [Streptomyces decoyicus]|uniref:hypothetical protein n=1 Tax=Streptomyces decoyicus TaxID=249567 RepID=UPI003666226E
MPKTREYTMWDIDPFTADESADYAVDNAIYTTTLGELVTAAQREAEEQRKVSPAGLSDPLMCEVDHEWFIHVTVPLKAVGDLAARHSHPGSQKEEITIGSDGLIILGCGTRFVIIKGSDQLTSREEWKALTAKRNI